MGLMVHCGAHRCERDAVYSCNTPVPFRSTHPIPHSFLLDNVFEQLKRNGWEITNEAYALKEGTVPQSLGERTFAGNQMFAFLDVSHPDAHMPHLESFSLGIRNSFDNTFAATVIAGTHVIVCDNLCFSGGNLIDARRKNTRYIKRDLPGIISHRFGKLVLDARTHAQRSNQYRTTHLTDPQADHIMVKCLRENCVVPSRFRQVVDEYYRPDGPGGHGTVHPDFELPSLWKVQQAFTEVEREHPSLTSSPRRNIQLVNVLDSFIAS